MISEDRVRLNTADAENTQKLIRVIFTVIWNSKKKIFGDFFNFGSDKCRLGEQKSIHTSCCWNASVLSGGVLDVHLCCVGFRWIRCQASSCFVLLLKHNNKPFIVMHTKHHHPPWIQLSLESSDCAQTHAGQLDSSDSRLDSTAWKSVRGHHHSITRHIKSEQKVEVKETERVLLLCGSPYQECVLWRVSPSDGKHIKSHFRHFWILPCVYIEMPSPNTELYVIEHKPAAVDRASAAAWNTFLGSVTTRTHAETARRRSDEALIQTRGI